jgi:nucleoid-associated protein YgaU
VIVAVGRVASASNDHRAERITEQSGSPTQGVERPKERRMGNFEKLSVVVIVVIIVMILVVAITEWTGSPSTDPATTTAQGPIDPLPPPLPMPEPTPPPTAGPRAGDPAADRKGGDPLVRIDRKGPGKDVKPSDPALDWQNDPLKKLIPDEMPVVDGDGPKVDGEKPTGAEPKTAATEIAETTHVVVSGDTLGGISKKYYGKASLYSRIVEANPGIGERDLRVGAKLKIPAAKIEASKALASTSTGSGGSGERASAGSDAGGDGPVPGKPYKVKASDTWERISKAAYKTSDRWPDIYMSNLKVTASPKDLRANLVIMIPQ